MFSIKLIALLFLFTLSFNALSQTNKKHVYNVKLNLKNGQTVSGLLYSIDSTSLQLVNSKTMDTSKLRVVNAADINKIKLKKRGENLGGIALGAAVGAAVGVLVGAFEDGDEEEPEGTTLVKDALGAKLLLITVPVGAGVGALVAAKSLSYTIDGNNMEFSSHAQQLQHFAIRQD